MTRVVSYHGKWDALWPGNCNAEKERTRPCIGCFTDYYARQKLRIKSIRCCNSTLPSHIGYAREPQRRRLGPTALDQLDRDVDTRCTTNALGHNCCQHFAIRNTTSATPSTPVATCCLAEWEMTPERGNRGIPSRKLTLPLFAPDHLCRPREVFVPLLN